MLVHSGLDMTGTVASEGGIPSLLDVDPLFQLSNQVRKDQNCQMSLLWFSKGLKDILLFWRATCSL